MGRATHIEAIYIIIPIWIDMFQMVVRFCDNIPRAHRLLNCNLKGLTFVMVEESFPSFFTGGAESGNSGLERTVTGCIVEMCN